MKKEVLICDSSRSLGKMISRRLMSMGISSDCCKSSIAESLLLLTENRLITE